MLFLILGLNARAMMAIINAMKQKRNESARPNYSWNF